MNYLVPEKSNQYYVSQKRTELSILVREMWKIEKYHWETCVVTGNYFSLRQDRPRAITYFQRYIQGSRDQAGSRPGRIIFNFRALQMKPDFISAWTLIGHEYLELRNFTQAIHSYHKGTTLDPNDCRAWFGLGKNPYSLDFNPFVLSLDGIESQKCGIEHIKLHVYMESCGIPTYNIFQDKHMISRKCIRLRFDII